MFRKFSVPLMMLCALTCFGLSAPAHANDGLALEITGAADQDEVTLTLAQLDAMPQTSFTTNTIWTDGEVAFSGVSLKTLLGVKAGAEGQVEMVALNDYKVTMPLSALEDGAPIVATRMDGDVMSVRDKGPFWVVFPYDADTKYQTETVYSYSIWQLNRLALVD